MSQQHVAADMQTCADMIRHDYTISDMLDARVDVSQYVAGDVADRFRDFRSAVCAWPSASLSGLHQSAVKVAGV